MKLLRVIKSPKAGKKWRAIFQTETGREKHTDFGAAGMEDFTQHHDLQRRENYLSRHKARENWNDPSTAAALSRWLLWGDSPSFQKNLSHYKSKFHL